MNSLENLKYIKILKIHEKFGVNFNSNLVFREKCEFCQKFLNKFDIWLKQDCLAYGFG